MGVFLFNTTKLFVIFKKSRLCLHLTLRPDLPTVILTGFNNVGQLLKAVIIDILSYVTLITSLKILEKSEFP